MADPQTDDKSFQPMDEFIGGIPGVNFQAVIRGDRLLSKIRTMLMDYGMEAEQAEQAIQAMLSADIRFQDWTSRQDKVDYRAAALHGTERMQDGYLLAAAREHYLETKDNPVTLEEVVFTALGQASMCWIPGTGDAVFDSIQASEIGNELCRSLRARGAK